MKISVQINIVTIVSHMDALGQITELRLDLGLDLFNML